MNEGLRWICENDEIEIDAISKVEDIFRVIFPKDFIEVIIKNDGAYPKPNIFKVNGREEVFNNLLSFSEGDYSNIIDTYNDVSDRLIEKIIPFAEDPFGNLICFDYRVNNQPQIIFWYHEKAFNCKDSAISYVCDSFSGLLSMLYEAKE